MHELAIAESIVQIAGRHAAGRRVTKVCVKVGHLRQVVPSALTFAFELLAEGTPVEGAQLALEEVPVRARCRRCGAESHQEGFPLRCTTCGGLDLQILEGEELYVESLELDEQPASDQELKC